MREKVTLTQKIRILPESPYSIRQITRVLEIARGSFYRKSILELKDMKLAVEIERIHEEEDDTLGHKKLAPLLHTGKNRVLRVMKKYGKSLPPFKSQLPANFQIFLKSLGP